MSADDLAAFLTARYAEAEALAKAADPGPWQAVPYVYGQPEDGWGEPGNYEIHGPRGDVVSHQPHEGGGVQGKANAAHIAAADPAHRLADIALKRAILALHATETTREQRSALPEDIASGKPLWWTVDVLSCVPCGWFDGEQGGCATVRQLGTEFAAHPAYLESWRP